MPMKIERNPDGGYRVHHRPVQGTREDWKDLAGPVFMDSRDEMMGGESRRLRYIAHIPEMKGGPWVIMSRDYLTGKEYITRNLFRGSSWRQYAEAVNELRARAEFNGWREVGEIGDADFVCRGAGGEEQGE